MYTKQIAELVNSITSEILGESAILNEDLSNTVDVGNTILNTDNKDAFTKKLINRIGKDMYVERPYYQSSLVNALYRDSWEYGSVMSKIDADYFDATVNESWNLVDGQSYDPTVFREPVVYQTFWNSKCTMEIDYSVSTEQLKQSFANGEALSRFVSMLHERCRTSREIKMEALAQRTVNNMIGLSLSGDMTIATDYETHIGNKAINLLYAYNQRYSKTLTAANATSDPDFCRYAAWYMARVEQRLSKPSNLFNISGRTRFTPKDRLTCIMHADLASGTKVFLQSDTYNKELVALPNAVEVPYWQGTGTDYGFDSTTAIDVKTSDNDTVQVDGILAVMFDIYGCMLTNENHRVTSFVVPNAEFTNFFDKTDVSLGNDKSENFVVFYVADVSA